MSLDIARPDVKKKKRVRQIAYGIAAVVAIVLITGALHTLKPAAPSVDKATLWPGTVQRGPMIREVRGLGTLVPETILLLPAQTDGQIEKRYLLPGTPVKKDTIIFEMSNPELQQAALDAQYQLKGAEAQLNNLKAQLQNQLMDQKAKAAVVRSNFHQAQISKETNEELFKLGLVSDVILRTSQVAEEELAKQNDIAEKQVETFASSIDAQVAVQQAKVDEVRALAQLKQRQMEQLKIRPGIDGMLQELDVEVGQKVTAGTVLARVAQPQHLKAQLKIAETQAKDIVIGQKATIDTHNGIIQGHVSRIDPAVQNGTVTVDCALEGALPPGARPDLSVEGTVELERLADVLYVGRPVHGEANSTIGLFKTNGPWNDAGEASRVQVQIGRTSVNSVEVVKGLQVGDTVILSDMSQWDNFDRIQLK
jgi:HlyD family secretion protein